MTFKTIAILFASMATLLDLAKFVLLLLNRRHIQHTSLMILIWLTLTDWLGALLQTAGRHLVQLYTTYPLGLGYRLPAYLLIYPVSIALAYWLYIRHIRFSNRVWLILLALGIVCWGVDLYRDIQSDFVIKFRFTITYWHLVEMGICLLILNQMLIRKNKDLISDYAFWLIISLLCTNMSGLLLPNFDKSYLSDEQFTVMLAASAILVMLGSIFTIKSIFTLKK